MSRGKGEKRSWKGGGDWNGDDGEVGDWGKKVVVGYWSGLVLGFVGGVGW